MNDSGQFYYEIIMSASFPVKAVMVILILASVWSWLIIFSKGRVLASAQSKAKKFEEHIKQYEITVKENEGVTDIEQSDDRFILNT